MSRGGEGIVGEGSVSPWCEFGQKEAESRGGQFYLDRKGKAESQGTRLRPTQPRAALVR